MNKMIEAKKLIQEMELMFDYEIKAMRSRYEENKDLKDGGVLGLMQAKVQVLWKIEELSVCTS